MAFTIQVRGWRYQMERPAITRRCWSLHHAPAVQDILMGAETMGWVGRTVYTVGQALQKSAGHEVMLLPKAGRSTAHPPPLHPPP